ncbi:MAG TPA: sigma-54 dependent transcriptional regulator [Bryobacteraceae bacterium]|jgi:DNA-binding NtrC family response regulator
MGIGTIVFDPGAKRFVVIGGQAICRRLVALLQHSGFVAEARFADPMADFDADCIIFAINVGEMEQALPAMARVRERYPFAPIIAVLEDYCDGKACSIFRAGACEVLPLDGIAEQFERWRGCTGKSAARGEDPAASNETEMARWIGASESARYLRSWLPRLAATDCNVLITGETGSGKELIADLIHSLSRRSKNRLVCINCAAMPETLLESELFGHERGSFTGATVSREGAFEAAHGGTIFLDEIGEMTPLAQAKILRALETREIQRVGSRIARQVDIRIVAATNQPLDDLVENGRFRKDLMYRLKVAQVRVPPLRDRAEDIPYLLKHFLATFNRKYRGQIAGFTPAAIRKLQAYDWPGNVRELRNLVEFLFIYPLRERIQVEDLPLPGVQDFASKDRQRLMEALASVQWNKSAAARVLKWSRMTLYRKMAKYEIADPEERARAASGPAA